MYRVGDRIKIFVNCFSLRTETGVISHVKFLPDKNEFVYLVALDNGKGRMLVRDEDIMKLYNFQLEL